ncbi:pre-mRNA-splicing factor CWC22-like [Spinacia oleracea]|uniref:Pre-mRNA-splicing factor CWC22-like n=1 Tax=Spinacia oleracea TaxID=3562 RepID=A0ABM3QY19_SPIOL|nr:pre-mRNA-splicing factor CWC22-like [Spinacia oleracea]
MSSSAGFQAAFSANSGSEVDDSAATHLGCFAKRFVLEFGLILDEYAVGVMIVDQDLTKLNRDPAKVIYLSGHDLESCLQADNCVQIKPWTSDDLDDLDDNFVAQSRPNDDDEDDDEDDEDDEEQQMQIKDETETNLINLRRTIYLTIMSSVDFEEAGHKLLKIKLEPGQEMELNIMLLECCSQERTYLRYYGLLGQRFCMLKRVYQENFDKFDFPKLIFG